MEGDKEPGEDGKARMTEPVGGDTDLRVWD